MRAERCPRCGEPLPASANFCPNCGAPVAVAAASERRLVTVVFVDMAGSTELAARLDAERFREVLAAFHGMVTEEAAWYGGVAQVSVTENANLLLPLQPRKLHLLDEFAGLAVDGGELGDRRDELGWGYGV